MTSKRFTKLAETWKNNVFECMCSPFTKITYILASPPSLKQFLRAISWAAVLILPQIKRLATLTLYIFLSRHGPLFPISL